MPSRHQRHQRRQHPHHTVDMNIADRYGDNNIVVACVDRNVVVVVDDNDDDDDDDLGDADADVAAIVVGMNAK